MKKTYGSRKQDIEMFVKIELINGNIKKAIDICEKYNISVKRFGELIKQIEKIG